MEFVTVLRSLVPKGEFHEPIRDELIRDRFVAGSFTERLREEHLTSESTITLAEALNSAQSFEHASNQCSNV